MQTIKRLRAYQSTLSQEISPEQIANLAIKKRAFLSVPPRAGSESDLNSSSGEEEERQSLLKNHTPKWEVDTYGETIRAKLQNSMEENKRKSLQNKPDRKVSKGKNKALV